MCLCVLSLCVCLCVSENVTVYVFACLYVCMSLCVSVCIYLYMYVSLCVHVCLCMSTGPCQVQKMVSDALKLDLQTTGCELWYELNLWAIFTTLKDLIIFLYMWHLPISIYFYVCPPRVCLVLTDGRREHWVHWNYRSRWLWAAVCVLVSKLGSSQRVVSALNHWTILSSPYIPDSIIYTVTIEMLEFSPSFEKSKC